MQVSISPPRPRPSIAIHIQPSTHNNSSDFMLPRKRKRSSNYSSSDEDSRSSSAFATSTALRSLDGYSSSSPAKEHENRVLSRRGGGRSGYTGGGEADLESEGRHHKRVKRTIAQMGGLSLYSTSPSTQHVQQPHFADHEGDGRRARSSFSSDLSGPAQIVSPMSNTSGTSHGSGRGEGGAGYHAVDGLELLEVDEAFMPRDHGHDHEHDTWEAYQHSVFPEIEDLPPPLYSSPPIRPLPHMRTPAADNHDIKMGGTGWYEPEKDRIVITDLDDSDIDTDANTQDTGVMDDGENLFHTFKVSKAYLQRFGKPAKAPEIPPAPSTIIENAGSECQALVLYRPSFPTYQNVSPSGMQDAQGVTTGDTATVDVGLGDPGDAMELDD